MVSKKARRLWTNVIILYSNEDEEQNEGLWGRIWRMVGGCKGIFYKGVVEEFGLT